jgi:predicted Zn-dependent protease
MSWNLKADLDEAIELKKRKEYDRAWELFDSLRGALDGSYFFWSNFAHLALLMGRYDDGIGFAENALDRKPENAFARSVLAQLLARLGRSNDAAEQFRIRLEQEYNAMDFRLLVDAAVKLGDMEPAEAVFEQWRNRKKNDPSLFQALADGYRRLGEAEKAETMYRKALELDPGNAFARRQSLSMKLGKTAPSAGIRELETMLRLKENRENVHLMDLLGRQLKKEKRYEEAEAIYRKILAIRPEGLFYRKQLGFVLSKRKDFEGVVRMLSPCFEEDPDDMFVRRTLTAAMKRTGRKEEALRLVDRLIAESPNPGKLHGLRKEIEKWP